MSNDKVFITCIGVDDKLHACEPHSDTCKCGIVVKSKKLGKNDYERYSCYECRF